MEHFWRRKADRAELFPPKLHHVRLAAGEVGAREEGSLGGAAGAEEQLQATFGVATEEGAEEGNVELSLLLCEFGEPLDPCSTHRWAHGLALQRWSEPQKPEQAPKRSPWAPVMLDVGASPKGATM